MFKAVTCRESSPQAEAATRNLVSPHLVAKMQLLRKLSGHDGCVKTVAM